MGMGIIKEYLEEYILYVVKGRCNCGCNGGIVVVIKVDNIIIVIVLDWGCYGLIVVIVYLKKDLEILYIKEMEEEVMVVVLRSGMIDMYGWLIFVIDGFGLLMNFLIVNLMRECVFYVIKLEKICVIWFEKVIELGYYDNVIDIKDSNEWLVMLK